MEEDTGEGLMRQINSYCERADLTYWSEPVNAVSNAAFLLAAYVMWRRVARLGAGTAEVALIARILCVVLACIGLTSYLWHTHATAWAVSLDVLSIAVFVLIFIYASNRVFWAMRPWIAAVATAVFFPYAAIVGPAFGQLPFFSISAAYWPIAVLIALYAAALWQRRPAAARGLALGAGILAISLTFRSVDDAVCAGFPVGTHFMWHVLNGVMLGWMIEVLRRDAALGAQAENVTGST